MPSTELGNTAVEQAYDALLAYVDAAAEGARLPPERSLAASLGVSRSTLRTAVDRLVRLGLLAVRHGVGTVVTRPDLAALTPALGEVLRRTSSGHEEVRELRVILEPRLAELAALRRSEHEAAEIRSLAEREASDFHIAIATAAGNALAAQLVALLVAVAAQAASSLEQAKAPGLREVHLQQRVAVAAAIAAGDSGSAGDSMTAYVRSLTRTASISS